MLNIVVVKAGIPVSHLCPPSPVLSTLHLFLLAFAAPCTGFLLVFCLSNLFPSVSVHVVAFSIRPYQMLFHNPQSRYIHPDHSVCSSLLVLLMFLLRANGSVILTCCGIWFLFNWYDDGL